MFRVYDIAGGKQMRSFKGAMGDDGIILKVTHCNHVLLMTPIANVVAAKSSCCHIRFSCIIFIQ